jgi:plasmid stabilization system protein ParE
MKHNRWTEEDVRTARKIYAETQSYAETARRIGKGVTATREWLQDLRGARHVIGQNPDMTQVPPELIEDRDRRYSIMPRDLTALLCGDPLPGMSALERR